jgi:hypothetical protein
MAGNNEHLLGFAEVCAALSDRFGTSFELQNTGGNCVTLMARLECGIELLNYRLRGHAVARQVAPRRRAAGFFVGVYRAELDTDSVYVDLPDQFAYACSQTASPTAEAIGGLVQEALEDARTQFLHEAKGGRRHA